MFTELLLENSNAINQSILANAIIRINLSTLTNFQDNIINKLLSSHIKGPKTCRRNKTCILLNWTILVKAAIVMKTNRI